MFDKGYNLHHSRLLLVIILCNMVFSWNILSEVYNLRPNFSFNVIGIVFLLLIIIFLLSLRATKYNSHMTQITGILLLIGIFYALSKILRLISLSFGTTELQIVVLQKLQIEMTSWWNSEIIGLIIYSFLIIMVINNYFERNHLQKCFNCGENFSNNGQCEHCDDVKVSETRYKQYLTLFDERRFFLAKKNKKFLVIVIFFLLLTSSLLNPFVRVILTNFLFLISKLLFVFGLDRETGTFNGIFFGLILYTPLLLYSYKHFFLIKTIYEPFMNVADNSFMYHKSKTLTWLTYIFIGLLAVSLIIIMIMVLLIMSQPACPNC